MASRTDAPTIRATISTWSIRTGSRPCTASVFRNHVALFQIGRNPRRSRSSICSGSSTVCRTYGPTSWLYSRTAPIHVSGNSE